LAPHLAAKAEGRRLDQELLRGGLEYWRDRSDIILVEGAGGLLSPLGETTLVADLAAEVGCPLIIVSRNALGMINQTLQTLAAAAAFGTAKLDAILRRENLARSRMSARAKLTVAGVVLNTPLPVAAEDVSPPLNRGELASHCGVAILADVTWRQRDFRTQIDWFSLAK